MSLINNIKNLIKNKSVLFTTPGHCQGQGISPKIKKLLGQNVFKADLSEVEGLDNLQNPTGAILDAQIKASEIYGSKFSYYLVNGSSSGIIALMLATTKPADKVLIARNAHKSVVNALVLSGAKPVWINTGWLDEWNIPAQLDIEEIENSLNSNPDIKSIWITSPTYEGIVSDIASISKLCKEKGIILIVDEAHGALWNFSDKLPIPAIHLGADASVQSLHKTASCLTQGAILHLSKTSSIDPQKLQQCLNIINTTSPSYPILASIEAAIEYLNSKPGRKKLNNLLKNIDKLQNKLSKYDDIKFLQGNTNFEIDKTKILLGINGVSGNNLSDFLQEKFNLEVEMDNNKSILALTGIGTSEIKLNKLANSVINSRKIPKESHTKSNTTPLIQPKVIFTPQQAFYKKSKIVNTKDCIGLISKETIVSYPPGIPVLIAGEIITPEHIEFLKNQDQILIIDE